MPVTYTNDTENLLLQEVSSFNKDNALSFLTDATVTAADTKAGLIAAIQAVSVHGDQENLKIALVRALNAAPIVDADILSLTTVAQLIALFPVTTTSQDILQ